MDIWAGMARLCVHPAHFGMLGASAGQSLQGWVRRGFPARCVPHTRPGSLSKLSSNFPTYGRIPCQSQGIQSGSPDQIRTGVSGLKGRRPRPLDDGTLKAQRLRRVKAQSETSLVVLKSAPGERIGTRNKTTFAS